MGNKDARTRLMNEILTNIRSIKVCKREPSVVDLGLTVDDFALALRLGGSFQSKGLSR